MHLRISIFALALLALSTSPQASIIAGHDYVVLNTPQRQETNGNIEVMEFFSWGCPHCYEFYPKLSRWLATLPKDARFKRVPVGLGHPEWEALARAFYALQSTGDVDRLDSQVFEDIHKNHVWLYDEASITAWVGKHGVNVAKFTAAYRSFGVITSTGQAEQKGIDYRIPGVPTLAIAGKYTVSDTLERMLSTSTQLIAMEQAASKQARKSQTIWSADAPSNADTASAEVAPLLAQMGAAANAHDVEGHVGFYAHDPSVIFIFNGEPTIGWDAIREKQGNVWRNGRSDVVYTMRGDGNYFPTPGL